MNYRKRYIDADGNFVIEERRVRGRTRVVDPGQPDYLRWLEEGNEPEIVEYTPPVPPQPPTLEETKASKLAEIAEARYEEEVGGVEYLGVRMHTDLDSQSKYTGAVVALQATGTLPENWKGINGWLEIPDGSTLMNLASVVVQHVNTCFLREKNLSDQIKAAESVEVVQAITWG
jgi:hypothetical protein